MNTQKERDSLRTYLAKKGVFTSIHWPTHELVKTKLNDIDDILWLESHIISIPVSQDYNLNDMEFIVNSIQRWEKSKRK
jgi:dTDP-4-amino-4,6-dideoxygalactose transaminase